MKLILSSFLFITITAKSQTTRVLPNAKAYSSTYINMTNTFGVMANGHAYASGLTLSQNPTFPYWITRVDLVTKQITKKLLPGTVSFPGGYWNSIFDSSGHLVLPINTDDYHVRIINMKNDSITVNDIGSAFKDANGNFVTALAYSSSLGCDGSLYFGAKGNPYWSWREKNGTMHYSPNAINNIGIDWVLAISGDANYIVAVTGQNDSCNAWIINKATGEKKNIVRTSSSTRPTLETGCDGFMYVRNPEIPITKDQWYKIVNGDTVRVPTWSGCRVQYNECNKGGSSPNVSSYWDAGKSKLFYVVNGVNDSILIETALVPSNVQLVMTDRYNTNRLDYVGALYGNFYGYDIAKDSSWAIGSTGYNLYSWRRLNDSIVFYGNYPGGALMERNVNRDWTANTYVNGAAISVFDTSANPHIIFQFKNTAAAFSHLASMIIDTVRHLVLAAGNVIRVDETFSLGAYNYITREGWGYDHTKINSLRFTSMAQYGNLVIAATNNAAGGSPKLYLYNPEKAVNAMVDSISFGFTDYGSIWVQGDQLMGYAGTRFYKVNLSTKQLIYNQQGTGNPVLSRLQDGKFAISGGTGPAGWAQYKPVSYSNFVGPGNGNYYSVSSLDIIESIQLATQTINLETTEGKETYTQNMLYNR